METSLSALASEAGVFQCLREWLLEPAALDVEAVVVPGDAHRFGHRREDRLGLADLAGLVERQPGERLLFVGAEDDAALIVLGEADPRSLRRPVGLRDDLHLEPVQRLDDLVGIGGILLNDVEAPSPPLTAPLVRAWSCALTSCPEPGVDRLRTPLNEAATTNSTQACTKMRHAECRGHEGLYFFL